MALEGHIEFIVRGKIGDIPISPQSIELGLFKSFSDDVAAIVNSIPEINKNTLVVSIEDGSFKARVFMALIAVNSIIADAATLNETNNLASINSVRSKVIENWSKKTKTNPTIEFEIRPNGNEGIKVDHARNFEIDNSVWVESELYLYGEFWDWGGVKANIHFKTDTGQRITITCKMEDIRNEKKNMVYHPGGVRVLAKQNINTGEIKDARLIEFIEYTPEYNQNEIDDLVAKGREAWADVDDHIDWVRNLRKDG